MGLMYPGGSGKKGKFLGFRIAVNSNGSTGFNNDTDFLSGDTFMKACRVHILAFTWASNDHQQVYVSLSGVGQLISAFDTNLTYLRYTHNVYDISAGQYLSVAASGNYQGVSGYVAWLDK